MAHFDVIPAIDLKDGRCVRLIQGDFERATVFGDDPPSMARRWASQGAGRIHVVDLDGAREGRPMQLGLVRQIARAVDVPVQLGGGLRTAEGVEAAFEAGVERVIIGTAAVDDPTFLDACLERFGDRIVVGVDARDGRVAVRGWADVSHTDALELAGSLAERGVRTIVYTDISRDGMLQGPNVTAVERMVQAVPDIELIASGGVGQPDDLIDLRRAGARGVIVGKALYTGAVDLRSAISAVQEDRTTTAHHPPGLGEDVASRTSASRGGGAARVGGSVGDTRC